MRELFVIRTHKHIELVRRNLEQFENYQGLTLNELRLRGKLHDLSKFSAAEIEAYTWLNWSYHCQKENLSFTMPDEKQQLISQGLKNHAKINRHHPEAHADINQMELMDLVEMIADWTAIAQENGRTSCLTWAQENLEKKWNFSVEKKQFIFDLIAEMDRRNLYA